MIDPAGTVASARPPCFDPRWVRSPGGKFFRLPHLDPEAEGLSGVGGVFVVWHAGVSPAWVYVGCGDDLAQAFHAIAANAEVMAYEANGGLFATWARFRRDHCYGVAAHLTACLRPRVAAAEALPDGVQPIPVLIPGQVHGRS